MDWTELAIGVPTLFRINQQPKLLRCNLIKNNKRERNALRRQCNVFFEQSRIVGGTPIATSDDGRHISILFYFELSLVARWVLCLLT